MLKLCKSKTTYMKTCFFQNDGVKWYIIGHYSDYVVFIYASFILLCSQVIENLDTLTSLQSLFLGTNKITTLQNLEGLHNLTVLSIQVIHKLSSTIV